MDERHPNQRVGEYLAAQRVYIDVTGGDKGWEGRSEGFGSFAQRLEFSIEGCKGSFRHIYSRESEQP